MSNTNAPFNPFEKGNQFYKMVTDPGRPKKFVTPTELWAAAVSYFEYVVANPIPYQVYTRYGKLRTKYKVQAMSVRGLCLYIDMCNLKYYKTLPEFDAVVDRIESVIYVHNFNNAAASLLKCRIIASTLFPERKRRSR